MNHFVPLHVHSDASNVRFPDSTCKPKDLIARAIKLGFPGIAMTDHECLSNAVTFLKLRDKIKEENPDFKVIFGNEIYLIDESELHSTEKFYHFILLAKDVVGWHQLKQLSSRAWERAYTYKGQMRVPTTYQDIEEIVGKNPGHIIGSSSCLGGFLDTSILAHDTENLNKFVKWCVEIFGKDNFRLELQVSDSEEQQKCNSVMLKMAHYYDIKHIITTDVHYLEQGDALIHSIFLKSKENEDRETEKFYKYTYMMSIEEMQQILGRTNIDIEDIIKGFENTYEIYQQVEDYDFRHSTIVPKTRIPEFTIKHLFKDYYEEYPYLEKFANSDSIQDRYFMCLIEEGMLNKHIEVTKERAERINTELGVVDKVSIGLNEKVSSYFLLMREVIDLSWNYSFVGTGRGSSSGFYTNYLLDLVQCDSMKYNLPYWRFINEVRFELPDIDTDLNPAQKDNIMNALREYYGEDNVLNCVAFKTETLKAAILAAMRALGYEPEEAKKVSAIIPTDRGHVYTLKECEEGNDELQYDPAPEVIAKIKSYPNLYETLLKIEGLKMNASIHASAVYIFNNGYIEHNGLMRAPNGTKVTFLDMDDTNDCSGLKIDLLFTEAQGKLMKCMDLLLKDKIIEWQGSLRKTYNKYLHPDVLDYTTVEMWENASNGKIPALFQWTSAVASSAIRKTQPRSVIEMATINSAIRVKADGDIQPIDRYNMFHRNIELWYKEMRDAGLNEEEMEILKHYLLPASGCSLQQEDFMQLVMDPKISGYTLKESNALRKCIAHKILDVLAQQRSKFHEACARQNTRIEMATYVWDYCIQPLASYSFSVIHSTLYSIIALQEMNLAYHYNPLYWTCGSLCIDAGSSSVDNLSSDEDNDDVDEEIDISTNYTKIGRAIANAQIQGAAMGAPDINTALIDFIPDIENNKVMYGLAGIKDVNAELISKIINNRPYSDSIDFYEKIQPTNIQMLSLIKSGSFDRVDGLSRREIMDKYLYYIAKKDTKKKEKLTATHLKKAIDAKILPKDLMNLSRFYLFHEWLKSNQYNKEKKMYELRDEDALKFFDTFIKFKLDITTDYYITSGVAYIKGTVLNKFIETKLAPVKEWLASPEGLETYYNYEITEKVNEQKAKYCSGTVNDWEFSSLTCYLSDHGLKHISNDKYNIIDFNSLPEELKSIGTKTNQKTGVDYPVYKVNNIAGTVIGTDNYKHIVTISTVYGVVDVKFYKESYISYNASISKPNASGKNIVVDPSWFAKGTKLLISGVRRDSTFIPKTNWDQGYTHTVQLITAVHSDGTIELRSERAK